MNKGALCDIASDQLLAGLRELVRRGNALTAELLAHLGEADVRGLHLSAGFSSMHGYCTSVLGLSECSAYRRITASRVARRFPVVLEMVAAGELHLAGICELAPRLTHENHLELFSAAKGQTKRAIERLVAERFPRPDVPTTLRKLPVRPAPVSSRPSPSPLPAPVPERSEPAAASTPLSVPLPAPTPPPASAPARLPREHRPVIEPLSAARYRLALTMDQALHDRLLEARDLMSHQIPDGDLAKVLHRALELLIEERKKTRFAARPARARSARKTRRRRSRYVPSAVRRVVFARDGGRCTFVGRDGRRCCSTRFIEIEHVVPFARGGGHDADNLRLVCRAHNQHLARLAGLGRRGRAASSNFPRGEISRANSETQPVLGAEANMAIVPSPLR